MIRRNHAIGILAMSILGWAIVIALLLGGCRVVGGRL